MAENFERRNARFKHGGGQSVQASRKAYIAEDQAGPWNDGAEEDGPWNDYADVPQERTWAEFGRDAIGDVIPDEILAAGGSALGYGSYDDNMKTVEANRRKYDRPGDDRSLAERRQGYALNALQIPTFGMGDQLVAAVGSAPVIGNGRSYDENLKDVQAKHQRYRDLENDWSFGNLASGASGVIAGTPIFNGLYKGATTGLRAARSVPSVLQGAPRWAGAPTTTMGRIAEDAAAFGLIGGGAGEIAHTAQAPSGMAAEEAGSFLPRLAMNTAFGAVAGAAAPAVTRGGQTLLNFMFRDPANKAARYLAEKFVQSGKSIDDFAAEMETAAKTGKPIAPVDIAPQQVRDAGTASARMPGEGRDRAVKFLQERQEAQGSRTAEDLQRGFGKATGSFFKTAEQLSAERAAAAKPHYDEAFASAKPVISKKIVELTNRPSGKEAINRGLKMAQDEGVDLSELVTRDAAGNITGYTTKALHYGKMALDDMIDAAKRGGNGQAARNLSMLKNEWLAEMDAVNPAYARARQIYAGHSANMNALESGRAATKLHPDQIEGELVGLSESEREFYRQGFTQKIIEDIDNAPDKGNVVNRIFGTKAKRDRLLKIMGPDKYKEISDRFGLEKQMYDTYADVNVGSATAQRTAAQEDLQTGINGLSPEAAMGIGKSIATGNIRHFLDAVGWTQFQYILQGIGQRTRAKVVQMLFSTDPAEVKAGLELIKKHYGAAQRFQGMQQGVGAAAAANDQARNTVGGTAVGGASAAGGAASGLF